MTDIFTKEKRSLIMSRISGRDTKPEMVVRKTLHGMGYRYGLHVGALPGKPDLVLPKHRKVIFVHGCFWHGHTKCSRSKRPSTNEDFWNSKLDQNMNRDKQVRLKLRRMGWKVLVLWECQTKHPDKLLFRLNRFLNDDKAPQRAN